MRRTLERLFAPIAVENLTVYLTVLIAAVSTYAQFMDPSFGLLSYDSLVAGAYHNLILYPFRFVAGGPTFSGALWLLLLIYVFWLFSSQLEAEIGSAGFTAYAFISILIILVGHLVGTAFFGRGITPYFLDLVILAAVCYLNPNQEILLYFIIPVKMKWLAVLIYGFLAVSSLLNFSQTGSILEFYEPVVGMLSFFIFFGSELVSQGQRRVKQSQQASRKATLVKAIAVHRCTVCGMTEHDDPQMDFRFCVDCADHEYCSKHLESHEHIS